MSSIKKEEHKKQEEDKEEAEDKKDETDDEEHVVEGILDIKEEIFQKVICSFLDRVSIQNLHKVKKLSSHFRLGQHFCNSHGTSLELVKKEKRLEFQRRKQYTDTPWITCESAGCVDCQMGLRGRCRCIVCSDNFEKWDKFETCDTCDRQACSKCMYSVSPCGECGKGEGDYCKDCYEGFYCTECEQEFCMDCGFFMVCNKTGCDNRGCCECMGDQHGMAICDGCFKAYCQECRETNCCEVCSETYCEECRKTFYCEDCEMSYCVDCKEYTHCQECECHRCDDCADHCGACNKFLCNDCHDNLFCEGCDKVFCTSCEDGEELQNEESDEFLCRKCAKNETKTATKEAQPEVRCGTVGGEVADR